MILYMIDYKTAHRMIGYFEEEAVRSYTDYLAMVENGEVENVPKEGISNQVLQYEKVCETI